MDGMLSMEICQPLLVNGFLTSTTFLAASVISLESQKESIQPSHLGDAYNQE